MKRATIFGTVGGLARSLSSAFLSAGWGVQEVARHEPIPSIPSDAFVFPQGVFLQGPLIETGLRQIDNAVHVGLIDVIDRLRQCLRIEADDSQRIDYCLIGSTSSYQGFANTAVYCAVKHGLLGLVRALNDEYKDANRRFWLFSPGTMDTPMGRQLTNQDSATFLSSDDVARRIVSAIISESNLFEPEVIIRRRHVR